MSLQVKLPFDIGTTVYFVDSLFPNDKNYYIFKDITKGYIIDSKGIIVLLTYYLKPLEDFESNSFASESEAEIYLEKLNKKLGDR